MKKNEGNISAPKLWTVLAKCYGAMATFVEKSVAAEELGLSDFAVLEALLHKGPLSMSAIAKKVLLANASMTSAIDRLDEKGLVERRFTEEDRRTRLVFLTPKGKALVTGIFEQHRQDLEALMEDLSPSQKLQLYRGLKALGLRAESAEFPLRKTKRTAEKRSNKD